MSYSSAAYFSQSEASCPSASTSFDTRQVAQYTRARARKQVASVLTCHRPYPYYGEGILLLVVQVLLNVEEGVEEDVGQLAPLEVPQSDFTWTG